MKSFIPIYDTENIDLVINIFRNVNTVQNFEKRIGSALSIRKKKPTIYFGQISPNRTFFFNQEGMILGDLVKISCDFSCMEREVVAGN